MIRLIFSDPSSGIPYVNTDFTSVLQDEHIKSYASILDGINYGSTSSLEPLNCGIVLSGCDILSHNGSQFLMGFTKSVIYVEGEFYQNNPSLTGTVTINDPFYLFPGPTISEYRTLPIDQITPTTFSHTRYFTYSTTQPNGPYIKFSKMGTSRYYKRVLKYFTSMEGDIFMTKSYDSFEVRDGIGYNDMEGFVILGSTTSIQLNHPDLGGRFVRSILSLTPDTLGVVGGATQHTLTIPETNHTHVIGGPKYKKNWNNSADTEYDFDMRHHHFINSSRKSKFTDGGDIGTNVPESSQGDPDLPVLNTPFSANQNTGSLVLPTWTSGDSLTNLAKAYTGGVSDLSNSELQTHRHTIQPDFTSTNPSPHENRPAWFTVIYYTKKINQ